MFFRHRRPSFIMWLMLLMGFKMMARQRLTDAQRAEYRSKAKVFRDKMEEACAVWDHHDTASTEPQDLA